MKQNKRKIRIEFMDGSNTDLELSKATSVNTKQQMLHLDKLNDGTWRLIYNEELIPDFSKIVGFKVVREGDSK